ncbi:MAG: PQQ-dependent sugar dehydrogenase [Bacteroidota bacterium]
MVKKEMHLDQELVGTRSLIQSFQGFNSKVLVLSIGLLLSCFIQRNGIAQELNYEVQQGAQLYTQFCASCHGAKVQAFTEKVEWQHGTSSSQIYASISEGYVDLGMPQWGSALTEPQINSLVAYLEYGFEVASKYEFKKTNPNTVFTSTDFEFKLELVTNQVESAWGMDWLPEGDLLVTDKIGDMMRISSDGVKYEIENVPKVNDAGQGGLLDVELHPNYKENGWLYLSYSAQKKGKTTTAVSRYKLVDDELIDEQLIFEGLPYSGTHHHYGCRLEFDQSGYLFVTIGDRGARDENPQDLSVFPGKVHRLNDDGTIPNDNPFVQEPNAIPSIFSYGHRNPQGMAIHPTTGAVWTHEHGPRGGDELNVVQSGKNYGWPVISYGINYDGSVFTGLTAKEGMQQPFHYWVPSIAPCGMTFVTSDRYPGWQGHLLIGSLKFENVNLCKMGKDEVVSEEILMKGVGRVRNIKEGPDGFLYVALEEPGAIYKIVPQ